MKVAPVSADLLIKIGIVVGMAGLAWYGLRQVKASVSSGVDTLTAPIRSLQEWYDDSWIASSIAEMVKPYDPAAPGVYHLMNTGEGETIYPNGGTPFTTIADWFTPSPPKPTNTGGASGSW